MGTKMTIEQAKEILKAYDFSFTGCTGSLKDAISTVLPIVEKYQKIEQIISDNDNDGMIGRLVRELINDN